MVLEPGRICACVRDRERLRVGRDGNGEGAGGGGERRGKRRMKQGLKWYGAEEGEGWRRGEIMRGRETETTKSRKKTKMLLLCIGFG